MEFARALRELTKRPLILVLGVLIAALASVFSVYHIEGGKLKARSLQYSSASTQVLVDSQASALGSVGQAFEPLSQRAQVYANFMASPAILGVVAQRAGLSVEQLFAAGPVNANEPRVEQEPTDLKRNVQLTGETKPYRLNFESQGSLPTITIYAQAPTTRQAVTLADASVLGLQRYVASLAAANNVPARMRVTIRQLGPARGAVVDGGIQKSLAAIVFVAVFLLWCVLVLAGTRFLELWRASAPPDRTPAESTSEVDDRDGHREHEVDEALLGDGENGHAAGVRERSVL